MRRLLLFLVFWTYQFSYSQPAGGPLHLHPDNPRFFADGNGKAVLLTGSHTWANFQEIIVGDTGELDYDGYLAFMKENGHNFMRMWVWEQTDRGAWTGEPLTFYPHPYERTGPALAADGKPKFDLDRWNENYFQRLRERVRKAGEHGIYVSVMLFQGWALDKTKLKVGDPFGFHPYVKANNINGLDVPYSNDDSDTEPTLHSLLLPEILKRQEAYVRNVIDTVNDLDNVLYEIINEGGSLDWQYHMIRLIKEYEATKPKQHPVGMTFRFMPTAVNSELWNSPADWISPFREVSTDEVPDTTGSWNYRDNPPPNNGTKVVLTDTDHIWGHGGNYRWVWKSFLRGLNPIFMDPWQPIGGGRLDPQKTPWLFVGGITLDQRDYPDWDLLRRNLGYARAYAEKIDLARMVPRIDLSTTGYCLASPGAEYLVYFPDGGPARLDLREAAGPFAVEWFLPMINRTLRSDLPIEGGDIREIQVPFSGDAVLWLKKM